MDESNKKSSMHANINSGGSFGMDIDFVGGSFSQREKEDSLAHYLAQLTNVMFEKGYIQFMSPADVASEYGKSRQFWEKLIRDGKIPYQQTASGKITTNLWVDGYLKGKDEYALLAKQMKEDIVKNEQAGNGRRVATKVNCRKCEQKTFSYHYNNGNYINGVCRNDECDFRL